MTGAGTSRVALPLVTGALLVSAWLLGESSYHWVVTEDGPLEWIQVCGYAAAAWWFGQTAVVQRSMVAALIACGFVGATGEELAWGQRLLDFRVDAVQELNHQGELTLHNVGAGLEMSWVAFAALAAVGAFGAWVVGDDARHRILVPDASLRWWFVPALLYAVARLVVDDPSYAFAKASEGFELCVAVGFAVTARAAVAQARAAQLHISPVS